MDILAAIKREERKLEKQLGKIQHQLNGVRAAANALGDFDEPRTNWRKEARVVRRRESENCPGSEKALGEGSSPSEESSRISGRQ